MKRIVLAMTLTAGFAFNAHAGLVSVGFDDFDASPEFSYQEYVNAGNSMDQWQKCARGYGASGVAIAAESMCSYETNYAKLYPDALLSDTSINHSGLLTAYSPLRITADGLFSLQNVDLLSGLNNIGMSLRFDAYTDGVLTHSSDVYFPPADPSNHAAWIGGQSWLFGFNGAALGIMDTLVISGVPGRIGDGKFFLDNLVVDAANVPEPGTLALFAIGGLGLLARRRRAASSNEAV